MSESTIRDQELEIFVVGCNNWKDKKWFKKAKYLRGGTAPTFQKRFNLKLIEGLKELNVSVWGRNTFSADDFICSVGVELQEVLSEGYDDRHWSLQDKTGTHSGEVCLIMRHSALQQSGTEWRYSSQAAYQFQAPNNLPRARPGHLESMAACPPNPAMFHSSAPPSPLWTNTSLPYASDYHLQPHPPSNYYPQGPSTGVYPPRYPY